MNALIIYNRQILFSLGLIALMGFIGCKSPIDLDDSVSEVPVKTNPVDINSLKFETTGSVNSVPLGPNGPLDVRVSVFKSISVEDVYIDTTDKNKISIAIKYEISADIPDLLQNEEVIPYKIEYEFDTVHIPIFDNPPSPRDKNIIKAKEAELKMYVFAKKKDGNGFKIVRSEKDIDLLEDGDNFFQTSVFAIRNRKPGIKSGMTIVIESDFSLHGIEIESYDRKPRTNSYGRSLIKIQF
jgi:hypothetical protein